MADDDQLFGGEFDDEDKPPEIEVVDLGGGRLRASTVVEKTISRTLVRDQGSAASIAEGEFVDLEDDFKAKLADHGRAKQSEVVATAVSLRGEDALIVVRCSLQVELTPCEPSDQNCDQIVDNVIQDAISQLRTELRRDLEQYPDS